MSAKVISFSSGKGGVGKTSLVTNIGYLYGQAGFRTLLIDGDWALGKLGMSRTYCFRSVESTDDIDISKASEC